MNAQKLQTCIVKVMIGAKTIAMCGSRDVIVCKPPTQHLCTDRPNNMAAIRLYSWNFAAVL